MLSIGLMSGTSMDGIDAALLETNGSDHLKELGQASLSYDPSFKILLKAADYSCGKYQGDNRQAEAAFRETLEEYLIKELHLVNQDLQRTIQAVSAYNRGQVLSLNAVIQHSTDLHALLVKQLLRQSGFTHKDVDV